MHHTKTVGMVQRFREASRSRVLIRADLPLAVLTQPITLQHTSYNPAYEGALNEASLMHRLCSRNDSLRDSLALMTQPDSPAMTSHQQFTSYLESQDDTWYENLIECLIYTQFDEPGLALSDRARSNCAEHIPELVRQIATTTREITLIEALLANAGGRFKRAVIDYIDARWEAVGSRRISRLAQRLDRIHREAIWQTINSTPSRSFTVLTGVDISDEEQQGLDSCQEVIFLISPGQHGGVSIKMLAGRAVVAFEPHSNGAWPGNASEALNALGHELGMKLALTLAQRGEMYVTQLAQAVKAPNASVSTHLTSLERANVVDRRVDQRRVYYRLNPEGIDLAIDALEDLRAFASAQRDSP